MRNGQNSRRTINKVMHIYICCTSRTTRTTSPPLLQVINCFCGFGFLSMNDETNKFLRWPQTKCPSCCCFCCSSCCSNCCSSCCCCCSCSPALSRVVAAGDSFYLAPPKSMQQFLSFALLLLSRLLSFLIFYFLPFSLSLLLPRSSCCYFSLFAV